MGVVESPFDAVEQPSGVKPLLLLDVDGVLNAFPGNAPDYTSHLIDGYPIHFHEELRQMVSVLHDSFEIVWFTLWNQRAAASIGPHVGLADNAHVTTSWQKGWDAAVTAGCSADLLDRLLYAKTPLLPGHIDPERSWVWIDDAHSEWDRQYLVQSGFDPARFRLIRTDVLVGLTWIEVDEALDFARAIAAGARPRPELGFLGDPTGRPGHGPGSTAGRATEVADD